MAPSDPEPAACTAGGRPLGRGGALHGARGVVCAGCRRGRAARPGRCERCCSPRRRSASSTRYRSACGEFAAGRLCARRALAEFGIRGFALRAAPDRRPIWPDTLVGSISHTTDSAWRRWPSAGASPRIGIDVEAAAAVDARLWRHICRRPRSPGSGSLPRPSSARAATLVFSAKEAFYKCWYPLTQRRLGFRDVVVSVAPAADGSIAATGAVAVAAARQHALAGGPDIDWRGRYRLDRSWVSRWASARLGPDAPPPAGALSRPCRRGIP